MEFRVRLIRAAGAIAAVALLLMACADPLERRVEGLIVEALPQLLGPAERYEAQVQGARGDGARFERVRALGVRVRPERGPVLDRVEAELIDVAVDRAARRISALRDARARLRLQAADLAEYLGRRWIEAPEVRFGDAGEIVVIGRLRVPRLASTVGPPAEFRGRLVPRGAQLLLAVETLRLGDRAAPALALGLVEAAINPLFDAAAHPIPARFDRVAAEGDALVIEASGSRLPPPD